MELKCAVVLTLVSLLSVKANPHGYGAKGGAVARAEAGAAAGAFSGVGLPLSIPSGPGFSGSFSKSSSSSFASSSASASSSSFSFSGSGATGYGLNSLGTSGSGGCSGGCSDGQSVSTGINESSGSVSSGNGLQSLSGAKAQAAAGAYVGSLDGSKNVGYGQCKNGVCSGRKSPCEGPNCKDTNESCKSGQCGSKPSSETALPDRDHEGCASGQCGVDSKSKPSDGNDKKTTYANSNEKKCASGQCGSELTSSSTTGNIPSSDKCLSGKCADELPAPVPGKDYESNNIPVSVTSISTSSHNSDYHLSNSAKASTTNPQSDGIDCKYGNCAPPSPNAKPYGYPGSNTYNPNQPPSTAPGASSSYNKPATHLTTPKQEPLLNTPYPTPGKTNCVGGNCDNEPDNKYPSPNNGYPQPQTTPAGSTPSQCNTPNCYPGKVESKPKKPSYGQYPSGQKDNPSQTNIPDYTQGQSPSASRNCASGNCGESPSYQPNHDIHPSKTPNSQGSANTPNCAFGNCDHTDIPYPRLPSYPQNIQPNRPLNCASGNCPDNPSLTSSAVGSKFPISSSQPSSISTPGCTSGNCGSIPTNQYGSLSSSGLLIPSYAGDNPAASPQPSPYHIVSKFPIPQGQPLGSGSPGCSSGNCGSSPAYQHGSFGSSGFQSPTYSGANPAVNCPSGNCPNYPSLQSSAGPTGSKYPITQGQPFESDSPGCTSGNCGSSPAYQNGNFGSSGFQKPTYSNTNSAVNCASGNCPNYSAQPPSTGTTVSNFPNSQGQPSGSGSPGCTSGNCGSSPAYQHGSFGSSGFQSTTNSGANSAVNCVSGNCPNYSAQQPSAGPTGSNFPIPQGQPSGSGSPGCTSENCDSSPAYHHGNYGSSGFQSPTYSGANPDITCASGNCPLYPAPQPSVGPSGSKFPISPGKPYSGGSPGCASGTCGSNTGSFGSSGFQSPSHLGAYPAQSGVVASGPKIPSLTGPIGQVPSGNPVLSGSGSCGSGNCPSHPPFPSSSSSVSNPSDKFPDYIALGEAGGNTKPSSSGLFVPSTISSQPSTGSLSPSSSGVTGGAHSQSSVFSTINNNNKEQLYTGGFGGPPGILKPYEFKAPIPNLTSSNKNKEPNCSTGKCNAQIGEDSINKHDSHAHGSSPCTSGNCGSSSGKPHQGQSNAVSGAFAGAAATAGSDAAVYTGGFGGPPGVLMPYDDGKIEHSTAGGAKNTAALGGHDSHDSGNKLNNAYGAQSGAAAIANAGAVGSGSYEGGHNKAGGCDSGCGASGHGSFGGDYGLAGGITKTGLLEKLHNGAQSISSATSGAGASSFAMGGSFASSSAHSSAGSATKGGYGR